MGVVVQGSQMSLKKWWFPVAIAVALALGGVFGLATATETGDTAAGGDSSATTRPADAADSPSSTAGAGEPNETSPDDSSPDEIEPSSDTTSTTVRNPAVALSVATSPQWMLRTQSSREVAPLFPVPEQTAMVVADLDGDGIDDIVIGGRRGENSIQWLQRVDNGWQPRLIEPDGFGIEAGGAAHDIDGDGDIDLVFGGDFSSNEVWWWENPSPDLGADRWVRRTIKSDGAAQHHDMLVADIDGDDVGELVFWNQLTDTPTLWAATIPADPTVDEPWDRTAIWATPSSPREGLDARDMNDDGDIDLLAGGSLLLNDGAGAFQIVPIADDLRGGRARIAQLVAGGAPELIFDSGDGTAQLAWFQWDGAQWQRNVLLEASRLGHSLDVADADGDGDVDILSAEMHLEAGADARLRVFVNQGNGNFMVDELAVGMDNHESQFADIDGDGDADIVSKPFNWFTPRLDIWEQADASALAVGWDRVVIDSERTDQAIFVIPTDVDGDGDVDVASGPNLLLNPGDVSGQWPRVQVGPGFNQVIVVEDVDEDGDVDLVGTQGVGAAPNSELIWARNDGSELTLFTNIESGAGDFVQGAAAGRFSPDGPLLVVVSWHEANRGVQSFAVTPGDPAAGSWSFGLVTEESQDEEVQLGDIDGDGDLDLMLGTKWIRNDITSGEVFTLHEPATGAPDRNRLVDMDGDGDLDVVVSYEDAVNGRVAWYEQGDDPAERWTEHPIGNVTLGLSLDVGDLDGDGDTDVVVGEHSTSDATAMSLLVFENAGDHNTWVEGQIHVGDEHHDGAQLVDIDGDGDLDIVSIGWTHGRTAVYLNPAR